MGNCTFPGDMTHIYNTDILIIFRGAGPGCNSRELSERLVRMKSEMAILDRQEYELDQRKMWVQQSIKNVTDDVSNHQYPSRTLKLNSQFEYYH